MAKNALRPPYDAPPIIEAVVQFRYAEPVSKALQTKLLKRLKRDYVNELELQAVEANVDFANQQAAFVAEPQLRLSSQEDRKSVV